MGTPNIWFQQATQHHQAGRFVDAITTYRRVLAHEPNHPQAHYNLGLALQNLNKRDEALASYLRAIAINPNFAEAYANSGSIFQSQNRLDDARHAYGRALEINPRLAQAHFNLGLVLQEQSRFSLAAEHYAAALAIAPDHAVAFDHLFTLLRLLGRTEEWLTVFKQFEEVANKPDWFFFAGLCACRNLGDFAREQKYLKELMARPFRDDEISLLDGILNTVQYFDLPQEQLLRLYQSYNHAVSQQHFAEFPLVSRYRPRRAKLRIGYLSADFREHVMGRLMLEVLARHDRNQFELTLYSLGGVEDALTERFRGISDKFVGLHKLPARQAARIIAQDDLDILVDLCNHTIGSNPPILAYKPARMQITHLGSHGAVGLDAVDYKLTDRFADLPENEAFLLEKLLPMEGCLFPFRHVEPVGDASLSRVALGIPEDAILLGVFANIMKLGPRCLQTWARILSRVEGALLAFSPLKESEKQSYLRQTAAAGIDPARVLFIPASKDEQFNRARYALLDMVLDTFPFSGGDTTMAALDMAIPVVTLCGQRNSERASYSILMNLGVPQTIGFSEAEFVDIACRLATDTGWRRSVVEQIRHGLAGSPLVDMDAYTRHLEDAYRSAIASLPIEDEAHQETNADQIALFQEAVRLHQAERLAEAAQRYRQVLERQPEHAAALYLYGVLLGQTGSEDQAIAHLQRSTAINPGFPDAHQALGNQFLKRGHLDEAIASFRAVLQLKPGHSPALNALGRALTAAGMMTEATAVLLQASAGKPEETAAYFNLGVAYQKQGLLDQAVAAYEHVLALEPDDLDAQFNLGALFQQHGMNDRAIACYRHTLRLQPDFATAYYNLGEALFAVGKINAWLENFQHFRRRSHPCAMLALYGLQACQYLGEVAQRQAYLDGLLNGEMAPADAGEEFDRLEETLYLLLFVDLPQQRLFSLYQRYNELCKQACSPQCSPPPRIHSDKIRLGYLSGDLCDHVMGKMMYQAISRHDTRQFEVICYSLSAREDSWTERFRACSRKFVGLAGLDARRAASRIAEDDLDILVDLSTHTKAGMPAILAFKPARVQITHIASAGAVGLDTIDFKLTDRYADTATSQDFLLERLLPMNGCVFPYRHIACASQHNYQRNKLGIGKNAVVLGAFVTLMKLSTRCLALWHQVLDALPNAVLAFSPVNMEAKAGYLQWLKAAGIPGKRVVFIPFGKDEAHNQARYTVVDMVLDTFPFGGVNGTLEAIDMAVPVVTLCGERHGERTSYSILNNLGVTATIANNEQEYVAIARRLANDDAFHETVVGEIKRGLAQSVLVDMDGHTRNLEAAYRAALSQVGERRP
jgi:predicted O-linked N-acetylglucosamine transferase (SPINDLY family)